MEDNSKFWREVKALVIFLATGFSDENQQTDFAM